MRKRDHKLRLFFYRINTDWLVVAKCVSMCIQYRFQWEINKAAFISKFNPNANSFLASFPNYFARTMTCNQLFASYHSQQTAKFVFDIIFPTVFLISVHENKLLFFVHSLANGQLIVLTILSTCSHSIQQQQQQQQNQEQSIGFINKWNWLSLINMAKNSTQIEFTYFKRLLSLFSLMF